MSEVKQDDFMDLLAKRYAEPDLNPYLFEIGQKVRLRLGRSNDGQTPRHWDGAVATVESRYCTGLHKEHWYKLRHSNGQLAEFCEDEIDARYARRRVCFKEVLAEENPKAIVFDGLEEAMIGVGGQTTQRLAVYSVRKIMELLKQKHGDEQTAQEWFDFNIATLWAGENTPILVYDEVSV